MLISEERSSIGTTKNEIESFVEQMAREYFLDVRERRSEPRHRITVQVLLQSLDDDNHAIGAVVRAVTRDLSVSGIGLICQDPLNGKLILKLASPSGRELRAIAEVIRCEASGYYFNVGCRFLSNA